MEEILDKDFMVKLLDEKNLIIDELKKFIKETQARYEKKIFEKDFEVEFVNID